MYMQKLMLEYIRVIERSALGVEKWYLNSPWYPCITYHNIHNVETTTTSTKPLTGLLNMGAEFTRDVCFKSSKGNGPLGFVYTSMLFSIFVRNRMGGFMLYPFRSFTWLKVGIWSAVKLVFWNKEEIIIGFGYLKNKIPDFLLIFYSNEIWITGHKKVK